ncbi:MAG: hypothetical protein U0800_15325 [Isosphaeraceae bacterium]
MPSLNRRVAARRLAWGQGPHLLAFTPAAPIGPPTCAPQAEAEVKPMPEPAPSLVVRFAEEFDGGEGLAVLPAIDPRQAPAPLAVVHADGSRDRLETPEVAAPAASAAGGSWVRLRSQASHLRVYAGEAPALALRQA